MGWTVVALTDDEVKKLLHYQLETRFERMFNTAQKIESAAMFRERRPSRGLHRFYFSPQATEILQHERAASAFAIVPCAAPNREDVVFVSGDENWCLLLQGEAGRP